MARSHTHPGYAWLSAYLLVVVMMAGTLPTPLYPLYARRFGLSPLLVTTVFAVYALAILLKLLVFARLSDTHGRRPVIGAALGLTALGLLTFIFAPGLAGLFMGRVLSGMAVGLLVGTMTAYLAELLGDRGRAALISSTCNMAGLGLGALLSGLLAEYRPEPLRVCYEVLLVLLAPGLLLPFMPETVMHGGRRPPFRWQRPRIPVALRAPFRAGALAVFSGFSFLGLFAALCGRMLAVALHSDSPLLGGAVVCAAFACAALAQLAAASRSPRAVVVGGALLLPLGLACVWLAFLYASFPLFLLGVVFGGIGAGLAFRGGLALVTGLAPRESLAEVGSCLFMAAYLGLILPVIGVGGLLMCLSLPFVIAVFLALTLLLAFFNIRAMGRIDATAPVLARREENTNVAN